MPLENTRSSSSETLQSQDLGYQTLLSPLLGNMPIHYGARAIEYLPELLKNLNPDKVFILSDHHVFRLYGSSILQLLSSRYAPETILIPEGENEKKISNLEFICEEIFERGVTKSSLVLNLGGGVILNMGGLAASLVYRGIRFVQIPTTLMAQSDVIISNKQGINFGGGKNRLGLYNSPVCAIADSRFFKSESPRQIKAAMVEYAKNALLLGGKHFIEASRFFALEDKTSAFNLQHMLENSLAQKFEIARLDPLEKGLGLMLEYGHTVGHALEYLSQGRLLHGEAVYHGMNIAGMLAVQKGIMSTAEWKKQSVLLSHIQGIPTIPADISIGQILQTVQRDNKKVGQDIAFIILKAIGDVYRPNYAFSGSSASVLTPVTVTELSPVLAEYWDALL